MVNHAAPNLTAHRFRSPTAWGAVVIFILTLIAYWPALHAGYIWDDDDYLTTNTNLQDVQGLVRLWQPGTTKQYYPMVFTTFWLEHQLWGLRPAGYHAVNILLHIMNALLVWRLGALLRIPGAWMIGAVFALHPVHVESVAWVTERKNVLSACFYLIAACTYLRFESLRESALSRAWRVYAISLIVFVMALLAKTVTCSLPAALILMMLYQGRDMSWRRIGPLLPMFALGLALALHTAHLERTNVGATGPDFEFTFAERLLIAAKALLFYGQKLLVPWPLIFIYPRWEIDATHAMAYRPLLIVVIILVAALVMFRRGHRAPLLAMLFFAGTLAPALGFFNFYPMLFSFVADHFQYLASLGMIAIVVGGATWALRHRRWAGSVGTMVLLAFTILVNLRSRVYRDEETLWRVTISQNDRAWMAHNNLGKLLRERGDVDEAIARFSRAVELRPDEITQKNLASALRTAARQSDHDGEFERAEALYRRSLEWVQPDPDTHMLFGGFLVRQGRPAEAVEHFEKFIAARSDDGFARFMLAEALAADGRLADARRAAAEALRLAVNQGNQALAAEIEQRTAHYHELEADRR